MDRKQARQNQRHGEGARRTSVTIPGRLWAHLDRMSRADGLSISGHIARAVRDYVVRNGVEVDGPRQDAA